jgi:hypothetical protein
MDEIINTCRILDRKYQRERSHWRPRPNIEDNIKMDLREAGRRRDSLVV